MVIILFERSLWQDLLGHSRAELLLNLKTVLLFVLIDTYSLNWFYGIDIKAYAFKLVVKIWLKRNKQ